jgi:lysophospholipase L1-like esterase
MKELLLACIAVCFCPATRGQTSDSSWQPPTLPKYSFIHYSDNKITNDSALALFYQKLVALRYGDRGRVSVVHIGDSHIQADGLTGVVRSSLQNYFGDAGRGLVFPYQLANTNAPKDIGATSNATWKSNRLTFPDKPIATGISGYGLHTNQKNSKISLRLKELEGKRTTFDRMVFFLCNDSVCYRVTDSNLTNPIVFNTPQQPTKAGFICDADSALTGFELCRIDGSDDGKYSFYGVSLEKRDVPGVLYHSIGINGARFDQFVLSETFFSQLSALAADLYIVSLGTNEAQNPYLNEVALYEAMDKFVAMIHSISPRAPILFTTPPASYYKGKRPNKTVQQVSKALAHHCDVHGKPYWDLFTITSGLPSAAAWKKYGLLAGDLVHFSGAGYQLQGLLLADALASGYNAYQQKHPYVAPPVQKTAKGKLSNNKKLAIREERIPLQLPVTPAVSNNDSTTATPKPNNPPAARKKSNIVVQYDQ